MTVLIGQSGPVLASQLLTAATRTSDDQHNINQGVPWREIYASGILLRVVTADEVTTPTITPSVQLKGWDGVYATIWTAAAAIAADGTFLYWLSSGIVAASAGNLTEVVAVPVPPIWRLVLTYGGAGTFTTYAEVHYSRGG